ncbi:hypothetical protein [Streptomyces sp. NBC_00989]|uniref:hypothetical protein n=1 Tax=Streptomyces sp. NBC_00989 TaxID=2903705 RepID=UPI00386A3B2D|nr:hypothetical protein OG714_26645 [Streptomyces sp. NBC_00989]
MSTRVSPARSLPRSRVWLRALVLLLALLVPGTHAEMRATPAASSAETTIEYDVLDPTAALRPLSPAVHRPAAPLRPAPAPHPASPDPQARAFPAPPWPPYTLRALRTVVLRC